MGKNSGKHVSVKRGYAIHEWSGPSVDDGSMKPFSVGRANAWQRDHFSTLAEAEAFRDRQPTLRVVKVSFRAYLPYIAPDRAPLVLPEPFELVPPVPQEPFVCAYCNNEISQTGLTWHVTRDESPDECDESADGNHHPKRQPTDEEISDWVNMEIGAGGSMSGDNPLSKFSLDPHDVWIDDVVEVD